MKKQLGFLCVLIAANFFIYSSCNKNDNPPPPTPKTKTQLLTQAAWKFKGATAAGTDVSAQLQTCQKDNIMTFAVNGTGMIDEGPTKCNPADNQTSSFNWNFASNETILHFSSPLFTNTANDFTLISLTETELVVSINYVPPVGPVLLMVITFQH
jgi:hypothetical protein